MEIKRDAYLQQLIERKDNGMIKVITGIRRCGKSFLLFTIFKRYLLENGVDTDHIIEIALDGIENEELRDPKVCYKFIKDAMENTIKINPPVVMPVDTNGRFPYFILSNREGRNGATTITYPGMLEQLRKMAGIHQRDCQCFALFIEKQKV